MEKKVNKKALIVSAQTKCSRAIFASIAVVLLVVSILLPGTVLAQSSDEKIEQLQKTVESLTKKIESLEAKQDTQTNQFSRQETKFEDLFTQVDELKSTPDQKRDSALDKLHFGGYGELHANFSEGDGADLIDLHRLVLYLGYDFSDWIQFHSEWEIEHGFVTDGAGGEFVIEQAYFDFLLGEQFNIRAGRVLTPLGIINKWHEPTTFNSVERPSFAKYIIPTTWSSDGIGIFGNLNDSLSYEAYVVGGLDGSGFSSKNGIRGGRIKERPSLHDPAVTGRIDYYAFGNEPDSSQSLRLGLSGYFGGIDNGNKGNNPGINGEVGIYSADFEYNVGKFDFLGAIAHTHVNGAKNIGNGTAEEMFGWYLEGAYHFMPDEWKKGKLAKSDAVVFLRYDDFDTQYQMPSGVSRNPAGDRSEWTIGTAFWPTPNLVVKADYQIPDDASGDDLGHRFNLGIGFAF
jgi:outer membrane murein-binding lipoprotein Lpp